MIQSLSVGEEEERGETLQVRLSISLFYLRFYSLAWVIEWRFESGDWERVFFIILKFMVSPYFFLPFEIFIVDMGLETEKNSSL